MSNYIASELKRDHDMLNAWVNSLLKDLDYSNKQIGEITDNRNNDELIQDAQKILEHLVRIKTLRNVSFLDE